MHKLPYWLAVEDGKLISYSDLAHLIASAIYPTEAEAFNYGVARVNLEKELAESVLNGALIVRNPAGLGRHNFPVGAGPAGSVLFAHELAPFLNERGIELRLTPYGSGPKFWTLDNAALAIAEQEGWHSMARETFLDQLLEAANTRDLVVRHPHTDLPVNTGPIRTFYELTTPIDVNQWLESVQAPYRWNIGDASVEGVEGSHISCVQTSTACTDSLDYRSGVIAENETLTKRERQIRIIEIVISSFGLDAMSIPKGQKKLIELECKKVCKLFGAGPDPFKEAWQEALDQKRVRTAHHNDYRAR